MTRPTIAAVEPEFAHVVAEGLRRHRHGARLTIDRIAELGGLHDALSTRDAIALLSAARVEMGVKLVIWLVVRARRRRR